jgi:hypothetical protein
VAFDRFAEGPGAREGSVGVGGRAERSWGWPSERPSRWPTEPIIVPPRSSTRAASSDRTREFPAPTMTEHQVSSLVAPTGLRRTVTSPCAGGWSAAR